MISSFQQSKMAGHFGGKIYKSQTLTCIAQKLSITYGRMMAHSFHLGVGKSNLIVSFQKFKMAYHFGGKIYLKMHCITCIARKLSVTDGRMMAYSIRLHVGKCLLIVTFQKSKMAENFGGKKYKNFTLTKKTIRHISTCDGSFFPS